jgi:hypothetical protein
MIPSTNTKLLVSEDWKKIYQSFKNADFKSYDFETLRRTMIAYLQENYPEDFNDYIESSEYIALVDLIAYLGQNLSFRIDLNARENFLETAQRRDSILRLAQLVSYVPTRNTPASGFLKLNSIATTDNVFDGAGNNLANTTVLWNDPTNSNWYQQFIGIINSAIPGSFVFGKPYDRKIIDGILTEQYRLSSTNSDVPIYSFNKNINGTAMNFEIVPASFSETTSIYEEPPRPANTFSFLYRNDNQGPNSANTGFFVHFRQGNLNRSTFSLDRPVANEIIGINSTNINNSDVWLWQLDGNGGYSTLWSRVPDVVGNNIIYNSIDKNERNIYSVTSRDQDQIDLNFADGSFGNLPKGQFVIYYRQSNGLTYVIKPEQMGGIVVEIPYTNKQGQSHSLTLNMGLRYTVTNSAATETNASIQSKAPQAFYTQNRMVTAEDYNIAPLTLGSDILKVKSVNRVSSGLSKYFDLSDVSGKYSKTNIFAADGIIYKNNHEQIFEFNVTNKNEILAILKQKLEPIVASPALRSFYFDQYDRPSLSGYGVWQSPVIGQPRGYFLGQSTELSGPLNVGSSTSNNLSYITTGALVKFSAPAGKYFSSTGKLVSYAGNNTTNYLWAKVLQVIGNGSNDGQGALDDGTGPIILSNYVDSGAIAVEIIPNFINVLSTAFENELVNLCINKRNFGLSFNKLTRTWNIVVDTNIDLINPFSLIYQGNVENSNRDASWLIAFTWTGNNYKVRYRITDYIFESEKETAFFIDNDSINYDFVSDTVVKDQVSILSFNTISTGTTSLNKDYQWQIDGSIIEPDGYVEPKKVRVSFYDYDNAGQITDPDSFNNIVEPASTSTNVNGNLHNFVYFKTSADGLRYQLQDSNLFTPFPNPDVVVGTPDDGALYYFYDPDYNIVKSYSADLAGTLDPWVYEPDYFAYPGRSNLKFHYIHNSGEDRRIDPSKSNIIDVYLLTASYDTAYRSWLITKTGTEPMVPTSQSLEQNYGGKLDLIKSISDEIVFQPVKYKVLFGDLADINLQAKFKAVKNPAIPVSDNELKSRILSAIQVFFSLENWDFGQSFYFSELATYVMNTMTPDITNFVIVPKSNNNFGSLYEVACLTNELFINGATANDIEIISAITANQLKTSSIVTNSGNQ